MKGFLKVQKCQMKEGNRFVNIELLRIIACFFVIVNHTVSNIILHTNPSDIEWYFGIGYLYLSKVAVPIFIMITGSLLLKRQDSWQKTVRRLMRIAGVLLIFSFIHYVDLIIRNGEKFDGRDFFNIIYHQKITNSYWYLYTYICLLIMIPFLQKLTVSIEKKDIYIFFCISALFNSIFPIFIHYFPEMQYISYIELPLFNGYISMLFWGYYIAQYSKPSHKKMKLAFVLLFSCIVLNIFLTYMEYKIKAGKDYFFWDNIQLLPIMLESICIFYICFYVKIKQGLQKLLKKIGVCTFGIYLLSDFFIIHFSDIYYILSDKMNVFAALFIFECGIFAGGLLIVMFLKKIPWIQKLI